MLLSLDLGTTHSKAGIFTRSGEMIRFARTPTITHRKSSGRTYYEPEEMWEGSVSIIQETLKGIDRGEISALGISSMAETGLLVDKHSGQARTLMLPWHDMSSIPQVRELERNRDPILQFSRSGIRPNFKCSLAKLLWIRDNHPGLLEGSTWLSAADYIAFRLTGSMATDYSLAGRTYAFRIDELMWDEEWLHALGLPVDIFPHATASTQPVGELSHSAASLLGLHRGLPVCISGHDHVCAAFAAVGTHTNQALDSMGTAEALVGSFDQDKLGVREYDSGLVFGRHVVGEGCYWMGGMSTSGGSLDWLRRILGDSQLSYQEFEQFLDNLSPGPSGIIFLPYLAGSGSPHTDVHVRGAFFGLDQSHDRADIVKAVLEGTAFEAQFIRQAAQGIVNNEISSLIASGSGTQVKQWIQIKADVSGCVIEVPALSEATLLGAALVAGIGSGLYKDKKEARSSLVNSPGAIYHPNSSNHLKYTQLYHDGFLALQKPIRDISKKLSSISPSTQR